MTKRVWIALGLSVLLLTSGCVGVLGGSGDAATTTQEEAATGTTATTTASQTATTTTTAGNGGKAESRSPAYDAVSNHEQRLRSAGSFTGTIVRNRTGGQSVNLTIVMRIDLDDDAYHTNVTGELAGTEMRAGRYTTGGTTYERVMLGSREQTGEDSKPYDGDVEPVNVSRAMGGPNLREQVGAVDFEEDGTATFQGQEMTRFTASGPDAWDLAPPQGASRVTGFEMTLLVDDQGTARLIEYTLKGEGRNGGDFYAYYRLEITAVGSTDVTKPDWTGEVASSHLRR